MDQLVYRQMRTRFEHRSSHSTEVPYAQYFDDFAANGFKLPKKRKEAVSTKVAITGSETFIIMMHHDRLA